MPRDTTPVGADRRMPRHPPSDDLRSLEAGLDRLQTDAERAPSRWRRFADERRAADPLRRAAARRRGSSTSSSPSRGPTSCPSPLDVAAALGDAWESGRLQEAVATSLERGVVGFLIAIVVGTPIGLLLGRGAAAPPRRRPDHLGPAGAPLRRVGARRHHLVRPVRRHRLLRDPDGRDPVDRQRPHRRRRAGAAAAAAGRHRARCHALAARDRRDPARRASRLRRRPQAGLGVLLALAHGRRDHRDRRHDRLRPRLDARPVAASSPTSPACSARSSSSW